MIGSSPGDARSAPFLLGSARCAFRLVTLVPAWALLHAAHLAASWLPSPVGPTAGAVVLGAGSVLLAAWMALHALPPPRDVPEEAARSRLRRLGRGLPALLLSVLITILTPVLFLALAASVATGMALIGEWALVLWVATGGLILSLLAAAWITAGVPALPLQVAAAVNEFPDSVDIVSRSLSYVRRRPLTLAGAWLGALASAVLGSALFLVFLGIALASIRLVLSVSGGVLPGPREIGSELAGLLGPGSWWPLGPGPRSASLPGAAAHLLEALSRLLPAFFLASVLAGSARVYLILRRAVDGDSLEQGPGPKK